MSLLQTKFMGLRLIKIVVLVVVVVVEEELSWLWDVSNAAGRGDVGRFIRGCNETCSRICLDWIGSFLCGSKLFVVLLQRWMRK